ncbi:long-chain-fatty-acid--CoA ligase [Rhodococcus sp. NPDC057529]|uniref:long-chain-fatty-acid--CoA ligase n=1 Tax=Rhodococcus sp. NPDC057529 TaxID=3346158 RepID=UPI0036731595
MTADVPVTASHAQPSASRRAHWANHVARHAFAKPDAVALRFRGSSTTWRELDDRSARTAAVLAARGVARGDRVVLLLTNRPEFLEVMLAATRLGAIAVPVNFRLSPGEVTFIVADSDAAVVVVEDSLVDLTAEVDDAVPVLVVGDAADDVPLEKQLRAADPDVPIADVPEDSPAAIMYTSGTTGRPKGAVLSHLNLQAQALTLIRGWRLFDTESEVNLVSSPLFHIAALGSVGPFLLIGATVVIHPTGAFDAAEVLDSLERERVTSVFMVPTQWQAILDDAGPDGRNLALRVLGWGAAPATPTLLDRLNAAFPDAAIVAFFGQTEMSPVTCMLDGKDAVRKIGSVGKPIDTVAMRVVDEAMNDVPQGEIGEIVYRGPGLMEGYWRNPEATADAFDGGWFHSGDLVRVDSDGFVYVVDRKKDMIISGGENIYCAEVENALAAHPDIVDVAVIGRADERWGEVPVAVVVPRAGAAPGVDALADWLDGRVARYKRPKFVEILPQLPRNASGKVVKGVLREQFGALNS